MKRLQSKILAFSGKALPNCQPQKAQEWVGNQHREENYNKTKNNHFKNSIKLSIQALRSLSRIVKGEKIVAVVIATS